MYVCVSVLFFPGLGFQHWLGIRECYPDRNSGIPKDGCTLNTIIKQDMKRLKSWYLFLQIMKLNCVWTLAPQTRAFEQEKVQRNTFLLKEEVFHLNLWSKSWAFEMYTICETFHQASSTIWALSLQYPFVAYKLLVHPNKEMILGIIICFSS